VTVVTIDQGHYRGNTRLTFNSTTMSYYAVAKGKEGPKIYRTWAECEKNVKGYSGSIFKKFATNAEAIKFIGEKNEEPISAIEKVAINHVNENALIINVFIDGSCKNNGKENARAGYACHFPEYENYNKMEKLVGNRQTNNRAE
jgi:ribonuclease HI